MTYPEVLAAARDCIGPYCKACPVCNGRACGNTVPGPGCKYPGPTASRNYDKWQEIFVNMDTLCKNVDPEIMKSSVQDMAKVGGMGIPTIKPWNKEFVFEKLDIVEQADVFAVAMDVDGAGLPFLKAMNPNAGSKSVDEMREIIDYAGRPFIIKGIMTVAGARKAVEAGAHAIVVSNHGGRVQGGVPSTAEVLPAIADAVKDRITILVDGGIRSGVDVFRALALGADGVLIGRPILTAIYGAGEEGFKVYMDKIVGELKSTMTMCGAATLKDIDRSKIWQG